MKHTVAIAILFLMISGCATQKRCNEKFPPVEATSSADSSSTQLSEYSQDSLQKTTLAPDSSYIKLLIECTERGEALIKQVEGYKSGRRVNIPDVSIKGNVLTAGCRADSLTIYNIIKKRFKKEIEYRDRRVEVTKYTNMLTRPQRTMIAGFWVVSTMLVLIAVIYVKRLFKH